MLGLLIRILALCTVVFAVVFAITRAMRVKLQREQVARLEEEIRNLAAAVELGTIDPEDFAVRSDRVRRDAEQLGVDVHALPARLRCRNERDG